MRHQISSLLNFDYNCAVEHHGTPAFISTTSFSSISKSSILPSPTFPSINGRQPRRKFSSRKPFPNILSHDCTTLTNASSTSMSMTSPSSSSSTAAASTSTTSPSTSLQTPFRQVEGGVCAAAGFVCSGVTAGLKQSGESDMALLTTEGNEPCVCAGLFTRSQVLAAPVLLSREHLSKSDGNVRAVLFNSGQANAATGEKGMEDAISAVDAVALELGCSKEQVLMCSTGVIGVRFELSKVKKGIRELVKASGRSAAHALGAARAICTTDLIEKQVAYEAEIGVDKKRVRVGGMCKGSGMIHPDMATMLCVVTSDAKVDNQVWENMVKSAVDKSFNSITVDGDTSTNDTVLALSSGASGVVVNDRSSEEGVIIEKLLETTLQDLAKRVARDGEGATMLVEVCVEGAQTDADARKIGRTIAGSNLNKAAMYGNDSNWGRIACAAGRAGVEFDASKMAIWMGDTQMMRNGEPVEFDKETVCAYLRQKATAKEHQYLTEHDTAVIRISVGDGPGRGVAWGCDLSYDYVKINAEYST